MNFDNLESQLARFGLSSFRQGQRDVISAILSGDDCLCVMPTGGGKSLCYQFPAVIRAGVTLVVSPLIALMKDQVDSLHKIGIEATFINSTLSSTEQADRIGQMIAGQFDLVYIAPERFRSHRFTEALKKAQVNLLAVDEAHCVSEWGHDFRPDYARLGQFRKRIGNPQTIALTATATEDVRQDIAKQLSLENPRTFIAGFSRPNLQCDVLVASGPRDKDRLLLDFLGENPGSGIIYVSARKRCEEVSQIIRRDRRNIGIYHAGMMPDERRQAQDDFMKGKTDIVVATVAFGMGIDKPDVRFVVHYNMPGTLEAYYQEAGRAGRDGKLSRCLMLYSSGDRYIQEFFIDNAYPSQEVVQQVYEFLCSLDDDPIELTYQEIKEQIGLSIGNEGIGVCIQLLDKCGALQRLEPQQNMALVHIDSDLHTLVDLLPKQAKVRRRVLQSIEKLVGNRRRELVYFQPRLLAESSGMDLTSITRALRELRKLEAFDYVPPFRGRAVRINTPVMAFNKLEIDFNELELRKAAEYEKLEKVVRYAQTSRCRQLEIQNYFGENSTVKCKSCDNCRSMKSDQPTSPDHKALMLDTGIIDSVKIALSGVARVNGRFGKTMIVQMLCGSQSAKITKWKLDRLSTFGLLKHLKQDDTSKLVESLIENRLIEQSDIDRFRPIIKLTQLGEDVMRGKSSLPEGFFLPRKLHRILSTAAPVISPSQTASQPQSEQIPTPKQDSQEKKEEIINQGEQTENHIQPSHYWTWRLLSAGFTQKECAIIRNLDSLEILDHATQSLESGLHVNPHWLLSSKQIEELEEVIGLESADQIRPLMANLSDGFRYEQVRFFLKCRSQSIP